MPNVCGVVVQSRDANVFVLIGREHLGWWRVLPEQKAIEQFRLAEYQVQLLRQD